LAVLTISHTFLTLLSWWSGCTHGWWSHLNAERMPRDIWMPLCSPKKDYKSVLY